MIIKNINDFIISFLSPYLCGYRKVFNTQHTLLALVENWRKSLDNTGFGGAILRDLSKAFDTLNHSLLIAKLHAYGFQHDALKLVIVTFLNDGTEPKLTRLLVHGRN